MREAEIGLENKYFDYEPQRVKVTGNIKKTIDYFKNARIKKDRLFHMFCEIKEYVDDRHSMFSDIWYSRKRGSGIPLINGVSIDETAYEMYVWKLRDVSADIIIKTVYFKNNDSAFECGFMKFEIADYKSGSVVLFNPSPFLIEATLENNYQYVVPDDYFASAYRNTYKKEKFYSYEDRKNADTLIGFISNENDLYTYLNELEGETNKLLLCISCSLYKQKRESILSRFDAQGLTINKLLFVDSEIFEIYPKRRVVIYASRSEMANELPVYNMVLQNKKMIIENESIVISYDYLKNGGFSFNDIKRLGRKSLTVVPRKKPKIYNFSEEIQIRYRFVNRSGHVSAIASYNSFPDENGKSKRLIRETEKGLRFKHESELPDRLDNVAFDESNYSVISRDIKNAFSGRLFDLSIKTLWFINRNDLLKTNGYNDELCKEIFNSKYSIGSVKCEGIFEGAFLDAVDQLLDNYDTVEGKERVVKQLHKLFNILVIKDIVSFNPFSDILRDIDNRMEEEQYEVRNALTKKNLSLKEQIKMMQCLTSDGTWQYSDDLQVIAVSFRLFTAMPIREMLALNWGDIQYNKEYGFSQASVTRAIDRKGKQIEYGEKGDWVKRRLIPLVPEVERLLNLRKRKIMKAYNISETSLNNMPVFSDKYSKDKSRRMKYDAFNDIFRKAILSIEIPEMLVKLPGSRELETDLNRYYSDLFISNFKYTSNHLCKLKAGEISYVLGVTAEDTKDKYYIDYDNDSLQYEIYKKLCRWAYLLHDKSTDGIDEYNKRFSNAYKYNFIADKTGKLSIEIGNELGADIQLIVENDND